METKIAFTIISVIHGALFYLILGGVAFGVGLGEVSGSKVTPLVFALYFLSALSMALSISVYFLPKLSAMGLIFILGGMGTLALWQFFYTKFSYPLNLIFFIIELILAGVPFYIFQRNTGI